MKSGEQVNLNFNGVDFFNVQFNSLKQIDKDKKLNVKMSITPAVSFPKKYPNKFKILMNVKLELPKYFDLSVSCIGFFEVNKKITPRIKKLFVNQNAPAIVFPYIRTFISLLTSNLGNTIMTIVLPPQFMKGELNEIVDYEDVGDSARKSKPKKIKTKK